MESDTISLYRAPTTAADADDIAAWLTERVESEVTVCERFLDRHADEDLPKTFARARVLDPYDRETGNEMRGIVRYEERAIDNPERAGGVIYDGLQVQRALDARIPSDECRLEHLHIPLLDRVLGTWGGDGRWHKRVNVLGQPALMSVPGLYEAPAKPEAYYREQQRHAMLSGGCTAARGTRKRSRGRVPRRERSTNDRGAEGVRSSGSSLPRYRRGVL